MDSGYMAFPPKTDNPIVYDEVKNFLRGMERRGATVKDLNDAITQLNSVAFSISTNALVKAEALDELPDNPFRSMLKNVLQGRE